jgi:hypothetical protein
MQASTCSGRVGGRGDDHERDVIPQPVGDRRRRDGAVLLDRDEVEFETEIVRRLLEGGVDRDRGDEPRSARTLLRTLL